MFDEYVRAISIYYRANGEEKRGDPRIVPVKLSLEVECVFCLYE